MSAASPINKSTGPVTPEGKAISSMNALRHGFRSSILLVPSGLEEDFERLQSDYREAFLTPNASKAETILFENFFRDAWNIFRIETLIATLGQEQPADPMNEWDFNKLHRHLLRTKSSYNTSFKRLKDLQNTVLLLTFLPEEITKRTIPAIANFREMLNLTKRTTETLGLDKASEVANLAAMGF